MWVGLIHSVEGLKRRKTELPQAKGDSACKLPFWIQTATLPWALRLPVYPEDFGLVPPQLCEAIP